MTRLSIVLALAVATSGCYVPNRIYNRVTDPDTGNPLPTNQSVVGVNLGKPPDYVDPKCTPKPFPEVGKPKAGDEHACMAFLEFDDMGELWDKGQLRAAVISTASAPRSARPARP